MSVRLCVKQVHGEPRKLSVGKLYLFVVGCQFKVTLALCGNNFHVVLGLHLQPDIKRVNEMLVWRLHKRD